MVQFCKDHKRDKGRSSRRREKHNPPQGGRTELNTTVYRHHAQNDHAQNDHAQNELQHERMQSRLDYLLSELNVTTHRLGISTERDQNKRKEFYHGEHL